VIAGRSHYSFLKGRKMKSGYTPALLMLIMKRMHQNEIAGLN
jgi:hypothetical protein